MSHSNQFAIVARNLHKQYVIESQIVHALNGVDIEVPAGGVVAVTGESGAGKSTMLHVVGTLDRPTSGSLFLNGTDVSKMPDSIVSTFRNSTVGFVFQMNNLLPEFTALENVMLPGLIAGHKKPEILERAARLLSAVGLGKREKHRPGELSGGEQQRVAIARALVMAPPILLADEPTGNLDKKTSHQIRDLLVELCMSHRVTMMLVTHDLELARFLPARIVMEDGRVLSKEGF
jgi:lipoprotein-releasing system ATP-binding protein